MRNKSKIIITGLLVLAIAGFFVLLEKIGAGKIIATLSKISPWLMIVVVATYLFHMIIFAARWQRVLKKQGSDVKILNLFYYRISGFAVSYLTPAANLGGEPVMAYLLSEEHKETDFPKSLASVIINRLIELLSKVSFIILSIFYAFLFLVLPYRVTFLFYIFVGLITVLLVPIYFFILKRKDPFHRFLEITGLNKLPVLGKKHKIKKFDEYIHRFFHTENKEFFINLGLAIISNLFLIASIWTAVYALNIHITFLEAMAAWSVSSIVAFIPIPAKIGVGEAGQSGWFSVLGSGAASGFTLYLIIRARDLLFAGTGLAIFLTRFKNMWQDALKIVKKEYKKEG